MPTFVDNINSQYRAKFVFTQLSQDVANNRSRVRRTVINELVDKNASGSWTLSPVTWLLNASQGGGNVSGEYLYDFRDYDVRKIYEDEVWITHDADGTKSFPIGGAVTMANPPGGTGRPEGTVTLTTIPRATQPSVSGPLTLQLDGGSITISMPRATSTFRHRLRYKFGSRSGTIGEDLGVSYTWNVGTTLMLGEIPDATTGVGTIYCDTYSSSGKLIGTKSVNYRVNAGSQIVPTIGSVNIGEYVTAVANAVGAYVQGQSRLSYAISGTAGVAGSTIKQHRLYVGDQTLVGPIGTSALLDKSGSVTVTATVTDSRGRSTSQTQTINVLPWAIPKVTSLKVERSNAEGLPQDNGTYFRVTVAASVSSLSVAGVQKNTLAWRFGTRTKGTTPWTLSAWTSHNSVTLSAWFVVGGSYSELLAYDALFELRDVFTQTSPSQAATVVAVGQVLLELARDGIGVGKRWEQGALDVFGTMYQNNGRKVLDEQSVRLLPYLPYAVAVGGVSVTGDGSETADVSVTFPVGRFTVTPRVQTSIGGGPGSAPLAIRTISRSASGATFRVWVIGPAGFSGTYALDWRAEQMTPTGADG